MCDFCCSATSGSTWSWTKATGSKTSIVVWCESWSCFPPTTSCCWRAHRCRTTWPSSGPSSTSCCQRCLMTSRGESTVLLLLSLKKSQHFLIFTYYWIKLRTMTKPSALRWGIYDAVVSALTSCLLCSFESWFDIDNLGEAESVVAAEREQNILSMLHQVCLHTALSQQHHLLHMLRCRWMWGKNLECSEGFLLFQILTPFLLRRLKSDVTLEVPPKKEIVVYAPLTAKQEAFYTAVVNKTIAKMLGQEKVTPWRLLGCGLCGFITALVSLTPDWLTVLLPCFFQTEAPVVSTPGGRPKRRSRKAVDYTETHKDTPYNLEKYLERVRKEQEQRLYMCLEGTSPTQTHSLPVWEPVLTRNCFLISCSSSPVLDVQSPLDAEINLKLQNILMLLKRCCNHPYLVEYPLDPATQEFKVTHLCWCDCQWTFESLPSSDVFPSSHSVLCTDWRAAGAKLWEVSHTGPAAACAEEKRA